MTKISNHKLEFRFREQFPHLVAGDIPISNLSTMVKFSKAFTLFAAAMPAFAAGKEDMVETIQVSADIGVSTT